MVKTTVKIGGQVWPVEYENGRYTLYYPDDGEVYINTANQSDITDVLGRMFKNFATEIIDNAIERQSK